MGLHVFINFLRGECVAHADMRQREMDGLCRPQPTKPLGVSTPLLYRIPPRNRSLTTPDILSVVCKTVTFTPNELTNVSRTENWCSCIPHFTRFRAAFHPSFTSTIFLLFSRATRSLVVLTTCVVFFFGFSSKQT